MRTLKGLITSVAIASVTLISYPGVSLGIDCSYGGVFNPPLPIVDSSCAASGSLKARGSLFVDSNSPMYLRQPGAIVSISQALQGFPFTTVPGSLTIGGGVIGTIQPISSPIEFIAEGQINNFAGVLNLIAPTDPVKLRAAKGITLQGNRALLDPPTLVIADTIDVETTRGNITLDNNTVLIAWGDSASLDLVAPQGNITLKNATIAVLKNGVGLGVCSFRAKTPGSITFGPDTNIVCIPNFKNTH